ELAVECDYPARIASAQLARIDGHRLEHWSHIALRLADHAQDLARGGLLLEALLQLSEQPHVLDRDHRLVRQGLQEFNLLVRERKGLCAAHCKRSNDFAFPKHRHSKAGAIAKTPCNVFRCTKFCIRLGEDIWDMDDTPVEHCTPIHTIAQKQDPFVAGES